MSVATVRLPSFHPLTKKVQRSFSSLTIFYLGHSLSYGIFQREQLTDHENRIVWLEKELEEHVANAPEKGAKSRTVAEFVEKESFLQNEVSLAYFCRGFSYAVLEALTIVKIAEKELGLLF